MFNRILVVCTGNICRSPLGDALLRAALPGKTVLSAGTGAMVGWGAYEDTVAVATQRGVDLSGHRAQQLTQPLLAAADLVLTMDQSHSEWINRQYPQFRGKVHKWLKWQANADVDDPYGRPRAAFEKAHDDIALGLAQWLKHLQ